MFIGRTDVETPILWPPHEKSWFIGKDPDAGKDLGQEEKRTTEDEMVGWHHRLDGHEFGWTPGVGDGQGGLACCSSWGHKESDMTERLNWSSIRTSYTAIIFLFTHELFTYLFINLALTYQTLSFYKELALYWVFYRSSESYIGGVALLVTKLCPTLTAPWTVAHQASLGFSKQEYRSGLPFPSPGDSWPGGWTCVSCIGK